MLNEVMDDMFHGKDSEGPAGLINDRQMPISSSFHTADSSANGFTHPHHDRVARHAPRQDHGERFAFRQDPAHQIAFGEDSHEFAVLTDEDATNPVLPHEVHRVSHGLVRSQAQRRRRPQPSDTLHLEITRRLHGFSRW